MRTAEWKIKLHILTVVSLLLFSFSFKNIAFVNFEMLTEVCIDELMIFVNRLILILILTKKKIGEASVGKSFCWRGS